MMRVKNLVCIYCGNDPCSCTEITEDEFQKTQEALGRMYKRIEEQFGQPFEDTQTDFKTHIDIILH